MNLLFLITLLVAGHIIMTLLFLQSTFIHVSSSLLQKYFLKLLLLLRLGFRYSLMFCNIVYYALCNPLVCPCCPQPLWAQCHCPNPARVSCPCCPQPLWAQCHCPNPARVSSTYKVTICQVVVLAHLM